MRIWGYSIGSRLNRRSISYCEFPLLVDRTCQVVVNGKAHYNYFREYDPAIGRYVESDPIGLKGGISAYGYVGGNPLAAWDDFGLCDTLLKFKTLWEMAAENDEVKGSFKLRLPVYHWETDFSPNRGVLKNPGQPPAKPSICFRHVGDELTTFELMRNVQFWQNNKYRQVCSSCNSCGSTGPMVCGDWSLVGPIDAKEVSGFPWLRSRRSFEESANGPCVKFPFLLPGMDR
jgi:RHS repeat-associated protein